MVDDIIDKVAKDFDVIVYRVKPGDRWCNANGVDTYINASWCAGNIYSTCKSCGRPEIWHGIYDNQEESISAFFHEMGHIIDDGKWYKEEYDEKTKFKFEKRAWKLGYKLAKQYNITFSDKVKRKNRRLCKKSYENYK